MDSTERLRLPTLQPGMAQKEVFVNEALQILDAVVATAVEEPARADPPFSPLIGASYVVGDEPTGEWSGHAGKVAVFTPGGWRLIAPFAGLSVFVKSTGVTLRYGNIGWAQVLGVKQAAISDVSGGTTVDAEARAAIASILGALRGYGLVAA